MTILQVYPTRTQNCFPWSNGSGAGKQWSLTWHVDKGSKSETKRNVILQEVRKTNTFYNELQVYSGHVEPASCSILREKSSLTNCRIQEAFATKLRQVCFFKRSLFYPSSGAMSGSGLMTTKAHSVSSETVYFSVKFPFKGWKRPTLQEVPPSSCERSYQKATKASSGWNRI